MKKIFLAIVMAFCASNIAIAQDITPGRELDRQIDEDILIKNPYSIDYYTGEETVKGSKITYSVWTHENERYKYVCLHNTLNKDFPRDLKILDGPNGNKSTMKSIILNSIPSKHLSALEASKGRLEVRYFYNEKSGKIENINFSLSGEKDDNLIFSITPQELESIENGVKERIIPPLDKRFDAYDILVAAFYIEFYKGLHL